MNQSAVISDTTTGTLEVPGAVLTYDVHPNKASERTPLLIIGSPMGAYGFSTLIGHFLDRTVIGYDPRGADRSAKADPQSQSTPDEHAEDLHRLISTLGLGPVDLFASSGGAVNALALVAHHPDDVQTLVAHEPPACSVLPDSEQVIAACTDIRETYMKLGFGPAMAKFIALVSFDGPLPADYANRPDPDPRMFGLPTEDDGKRTDPLLAQNMVTCNAYRPDFDALRTAATRLVIAVGEEGQSATAGRAAIEVARRLGQEPVVFPGGHNGFQGNEYGQPGKPDEFAATLHEVLDG